MTRTDEVKAIATELKRRTIAKITAAEQSRGSLARAHFAELRKRLVKGLGEIRKLLPEGKEILRSGQDVLDSDVVINHLQRGGLQRAVDKLKNVVNGKAAHAYETAIEQLDALGDDQQRWPKEDRFAGTLANAGAARATMDAIVSIVKAIGVNAMVKVRREIEDHPLAVDDEIEPGTSGDGIKVILNLN
jgi:phage host-nuclease inhibitor protein Gam